MNHCFSDRGSSSRAAARWMIVLSFLLVQAIVAFNSNHPSEQRPRSETERNHAVATTTQPEHEIENISSVTLSMLSERFPGADFDGWEGNRKNRRPCLCPDDDGEFDDEHEDDPESLLEDRREALFAAMGSLWAAAGTAAAFPRPSFAVAGTDANMAFPDVLGGMNDRATKECLVESLGNRECMVYKETDPDKLLYKGIDAETLIGRIEKAASALSGIPPLVEKKKWNDVTGLLIGPMGELSSTLTLLSGDDAKKTKLARKVKEDLFAMGTATTQRRCDAILEHHAAATKDLAEFLKAAL